MKLALSKNTTRIILAVLIILWTCFIFSNSLKNADDSDMQSNVIVDLFVERILCLENEDLTEHALLSITVLIRKLAHFTEFAILSSLTFFFVRCFDISLGQMLSIPVLTAFIVAVVDEFLQLFSEGRSCSFIDSLIDTSGGIFAVLFLYIIFIKIKVLRGKDE